MGSRVEWREDASEPLSLTPKGRPVKLHLPLCGETHEAAAFSLQDCLLNFNWVHSAEADHVGQPCVLISSFPLILCLPFVSWRNHNTSSLHRSFPPSVQFHFISSSVFFCSPNVVYGPVECLSPVRLCNVWCSATSQLCNVTSKMTARLKSCSLNSTGTKTQKLASCTTNVGYFLQWQYSS